MIWFNMNKKKILISIIILTVIIMIAIIALNFSTKYKSISISESKWNDIKNERYENANLILENIKFNDYNLAIDEKNNTLYYSLINDSKTKYNPSVSSSAMNKNIKIGILSDEITEEKILNHHEFKLMVYDENRYHIYNLICTNLPILNISYKEEPEDKEESIPMEMYLFNNLSNTPNKITISSGKLKIKDNKYTFSLNMTTPGDNIRENKISIFNMNPHSKYILKEINDEEEDTETGKDDNKHRVELFINNEHIGIYSLEHNTKKDNI